MSQDVTSLENRIRNAKAFLNAQVTNCKVSDNTTNQTLRQLGYHMDTIHEIERVGLRNLNDIERVKLTRVLGDVEETMGVTISDN